MPFSIEQRVFNLDNYSECKSFITLTERFTTKYPQTASPAKIVVKKLITKFRITGSVGGRT